MPSNLRGNNMARPKAKIPRLTFGPPVRFVLNEQQWLEVEHAFECHLNEQVRQEIAGATAQFLRFAEAESNVGLMAEAMGRATQVRTCASSLLEIIDDISMPAGTRNYVDDLIALGGGRRDLNPFRVELQWFVQACDSALGDMALISDQTNWPDGWSWQIWVRQLTEIAGEYGLQTGVRKDTDKIKNENVSVFVNFVDKLQDHIPEKHRKHIHSKNALAVAISKARLKKKSILD
jgi:hypothetical protein